MRLKIKQLAKERKVTLKELAEKAGLSQNRLSRIVNGENPRMTTLARIAAVLAVSVSDLIENDTDTEYCPTCGQKINNNLKY